MQERTHTCAYVSDLSSQKKSTQEREQVPAGRERSKQRCPEDWDVQK